MCLCIIRVLVPVYAVSNGGDAGVREPLHTRL